MPEGLAKKSNKKKGKNIICNGRGNSLILVVISLLVENLTVIAAAGAHILQAAKHVGKKMPPASVAPSLAMCSTQIQ